MALKWSFLSERESTFVGRYVFPVKALFKCYLVFNVLLNMYFQVVVITLINQQNQLPVWIQHYQLSIRLVMQPALNASAFNSVQCRIYGKWYFNYFVHSLGRKQTFISRGSISFCLLATHDYLYFFYGRESAFLQSTRQFLIPSQFICICKISILNTKS